MNLMPIGAKADRLKVARRARKYGFCRYSEQKGEVRCPRCSADVTAPRYINYTGTGKYEPWGKVLDRAMLEHLDPADDLCKPYI